MESDTYYSVYCTHNHQHAEKSSQIYLCIEQQEKLTEPEPLPVQGYWAVLAYTVIQETR